MEFKVKDAYFESFEGLLELIKDLKNECCRLEEENKELKTKTTKTKKKTTKNDK